MTAPIHPIASPDTSRSIVRKVTLHELRTGAIDAYLIVEVDQYGRPTSVRISGMSFGNDLRHFAEKIAAGLTEVLQRKELE